MRTRILFLLGLILLPLALVVPSLSAHAGHDHAESETREQEMTGRELGQARLTEAKKQVCENRTEAMEAIMARSIKRADRYGEFFAATTDRVKLFVENQEQAVDPKLLNALETAQMKFNTDLRALKDMTVIDCDGDDPKGQIQAFQEVHHTVVQDLKNWRAALKDVMAPFKADRTTE